jgi:hypothetical protein
MWFIPIVWEVKADIISCQEGGGLPRNLQGSPETNEYWMEATEIVQCRGHPAVRATHRTTFEVTMEDWLTSCGDCIIGICADRGAAGLSSDFRRVLAQDMAVLVTTLSVPGVQATIHSRGSAKMTLSHPTDLVWRKSGYVCGRTVGIYSDHSAQTLPRDMIAALQKGEELTVRLSAIKPL